MTWSIIEQTEKRGKTEFPVKCKHVKFFPTKDNFGRVDGFGRLNFLCLRVVIRSERGTEFKLLLSVTNGDYKNPQFTIAHEDKIGKPEIWVGEGKRRRKIKDELAADVVIPGEREKYPYIFDFEARIRKLGGEQLLKEVMDAFASRFGELASRSMKVAA